MSNELPPVEVGLENSSDSPHSGESEPRGIRITFPAGTLEAWGRCFELRKRMCETSTPAIERCNYWWDQLAGHLATSPPYNAVMHHIHVQHALEHLAQAVVDAGLSQGVHNLDGLDVGVRRPAALILQRAVQITERWPSQIRCDDDLNKQLDALLDFPGLNRFASATRHTLAKEIRTDVLGVPGATPPMSHVAPAHVKEPPKGRRARGGKPRMKNTLAEQMAIDLKSKNPAWTIKDIHAKVKEVHPSAKPKTLRAAITRVQKRDSRSRMKAS